MCDCLKQYREILSKDETMLNPIIKTHQMTNLNTGKTIEKAGRLNLSYFPINKNGNAGKTIVRTFVAFEYCPLCGVKYDT